MLLKKNQVEKLLFWSSFIVISPQAIIFLHYLIILLHSFYNVLSQSSVPFVIYILVYRISQSVSNWEWSSLMRCSRLEFFHMVVGDMSWARRSRKTANTSNLYARVRWACHNLRPDWRRRLIVVPTDNFRFINQIDHASDGRCYTAGLEKMTENEINVWHLNYLLFENQVMGHVEGVCFINQSRGYHDYTVVT